MSFRVIQVQPTPNPNAMKFILDSKIAEKPESFFKATAAAGHAVATRLFEIDGVASVLLLNDFVTINKTPAAQWSPLTAAVKKALQQI
jgi:hypothetical protein